MRKSYAKMNDDVIRRMFATILDNQPAASAPGNEGRLCRAAAFR